MKEHDSSSFEKFSARHPHWSGTLLLSRTSDELIQGEHKQKGKYEVISNELHVRWDNYPKEIYYLVAGVYFQSSLIERMNSNLVPIDRVSCVDAYGKDVVVKKLTLLIPETDYEVTLRVGTSDLPTFGQVFSNKEYESINLPRDAAKIVDLGANIGLGTIFFGLKYPKAEILAIEPDGNNFSLLSKNTSALGQRLKLREAAVWIDDGTINLQTETEEGEDLGAWGRQVSGKNTKSSRPVLCYKLKTLMDEARFDHVDILKIDIEGAEFELFSSGVIEWIDRVSLIIVETHDRFRAGTDAAVRSALSSRFRELPRNGENLFFVRNNV